MAYLNPIFSNKRYQRTPIKAYALIIMRPIILAILFILFNNIGYSQTFLDSYKKYKLDKLDTLSNLKIKKKIKSFIKSQIIELDTVFQSYKSRTNFDFNSADTLFLIYYSQTESLFTSDIIIWSGKDTISYRQGFESIKPYKYKRIITYRSFILTVDKQKGFKVITEADSLIALVAKMDFNTINHLGDNQSISDGAYVSIYVAYKDKGKYKIESCFPRKFMIRDAYRNR